MRSPWTTFRQVKCNEKNQCYKSKRQYPFNDSILQQYNSIAKQSALDIDLAKKGILQ